MLSKELEDRNDVLFNKLVPVMDKASTKEGEMLRAINKIVYRYYNDGDYYFEGYGCETAGPAHAYLVDDSPLASQLRKIFRHNVWDTEYEKMLSDATEIIISYIEGKNGDYTENTDDMLDSKSHFEDYEVDDEVY